MDARRQYKPTHFYLSSLDVSVIDKANKQIVNNL